jgi:hypothetical protein
MKIGSKIFIMLSVFTLFISVAAGASGAILTISSSGNGVFALQGAGLADVAGIDVTISYDTATLANPRVVQGGMISGAMMMANPNYSPGVIRIVIVTTRIIAGSGLIATINFDRPGGGNGKVLSLNAKVINQNGAPINVGRQIINPTDTSSLSGGTDTTGTGSRYLGPAGMDIPSEKGESPQQKDVPGTAPELMSVETGEVRAEEPTVEDTHDQRSPAAQIPAASPENKFVVYKSVPERFREYKGEKSPRALVALFSVEPMPGVRQEPAVALSDGKTRIKVFIQLPSVGKEAPNFSLKGAKLISLKMNEDSWVIEALPAEKVHEAAITVLNNGSMMEIPLTVAPPMNPSTDKIGNLGEAEFSLFMKERGTEKTPRFDLNGDGVRNYMDDYIFTANFIVKRDSERKQKEVPKHNP